MTDLFSYYARQGISRPVFDLSQAALEAARSDFEALDWIKERRQLDVLAAFSDAYVSESAFVNKTGYGYDDAGRDQLELAFARAFGAEDALVRLQFSSGTHVLATCLRALLAPGDQMLIVTGRPYDSLLGTLGHLENLEGQPLDREGPLSRQSLSQRGVQVSYMDLLAQGQPDLEGISRAVNPSTSLVYIQKSRGYAVRPALMMADIQAIVRVVKAANPETLVFVDHCYAEFIELLEPPQVGADLIAGSLIKNPGSGIAPGGGYVAGRADLIEEISQGMTAVGVGRHVGPSFGMTRSLLQGLYFAPTVAASAMKGAIHLAWLFHLAGYEVLPGPGDPRGDIVQAVRLGSADRLEAFCRAIQSSSPVDSFVTPIPAPMPGYDCEVIMASGSFIQGSTIELSADGPLRPPFDVFVQGGLTFENARLGAMKALEAMTALEGKD